MFLTTRQARRMRNVILVSAFFLTILFMNTDYFLKTYVWQFRTSVYVPIDFSPEGLEAYKNLWVGFAELNYVHCSHLLERSTANSVYPRSMPRIGATQIALDSGNCSSFLRTYGFNRYTPVTKEEEDFPLAYIILFHKDLYQVLFFLRAIYRRHNVYCLYVDLDSGPAFINAVKAVIKCLHNVFLIDKLESIVYAGFSRLQADLDCMKELVKHPVKWKYLHNMPGQQFPLRTSLEIVKILKLYRGSNDFLGMSRKRSHPRRFKIKHHLVYNNSTGKRIIAESADRKFPPPHGFKIVKGSTYGSFSRSFVEFILNDRKVNDLMEWSRDIESPDEYIFPTVHYTHIMDVPGGYQDFPMLMKRQELFANKFYIDHYPAALHCLDQYLYNLTVSGITRNLTFYRNLNFLGTS